MAPRILTALAVLACVWTTPALAQDQTKGLFVETSAGLVPLTSYATLHAGILRMDSGSMDEILEYCSTTWGVSFPVFDKVKVNGGKAAPIYKALKDADDAQGNSGRIQWNFEKFVLTPGGEVHRFRPNVKPDDPAVVSVIEANLPR